MVETNSAIFGAMCLALALFVLAILFGALILLACRRLWPRLQKAFVERDADGGIRVGGVLNAARHDDKLGIWWLAQRWLFADRSEPAE